MFKLNKLLICAMLVVAPMLGVSAAEPEADEYKGSLVLFLTQTDGSVAGHGIHIATSMQSEGRPTTVMLTGEALRLAVKGQQTETSPISGLSLQDSLKAFQESGGAVFYTPPSLKVINAEPTDLIEGVTPPIDHPGLHDHMFESRTKLMVF